MNIIPMVMRAKRLVKLSFPFNMGCKDTRCNEYKIKKGLSPLLRLLQRESHWDGHSQTHRITIHLSGNKFLF
jgi:hypothetical protein